MYAALSDAYPESTFEESKFAAAGTSPFSFIRLLTVIDELWQSEHNRRRFFEDFAETKGFEPLLAENWYSITSKDIKRNKVMRII